MGILNKILDGIKEEIKSELSKIVNPDSAAARKQFPNRSRQHRAPLKNNLLTPRLSTPATSILPESLPMTNSPDTPSSGRFTPTHLTLPLIPDAIRSPISSAKTVLLFLRCW